jgi:hypothetical protein
MPTMESTGTRQPDVQTFVEYVRSGHVTPRIARMLVDRSPSTEEVKRQLRYAELKRCVRLHEIQAEACEQYAWRKSLWMFYYRLCDRLKEWDHHLQLEMECLKDDVRAAALRPRMCAIVRAQGGVVHEMVCN